VLLYYLPIYFQAVLGVSAVESGIRNLALIIGVSKSCSRSLTITGSQANILNSNLHHHIRWLDHSIRLLHAIRRIGLMSGHRRLWTDLYLRPELFLGSLDRLPGFDRHGSWDVLPDTCHGWSSDVCSGRCPDNDCNLDV
jgi:hypothetical protein